MISKAGASSHSVKRLRALSSSAKRRRKESAFVVEGPNPIAEASNSGLVEVLYVTANWADQYPFLGDVADASNAIVMFEVDDSVLCSALDSVQPRPIAAICKQPTLELDSLPRTGHVLVCVEIADPGNLGTIIRSAEAAGIAGIVLVEPSVDLFNPKVVRASAGSLLRLPIARVDTVPYGWFEATGRRLVATVVASDDGSAAESPISLYDLKIDEPAVGLAVAVGNETRGLPEALLSRSDQLMTIPMARDVESLNVAMAASIICFELSRRGVSEA